MFYIASYYQRGRRVEQDFKEAMRRYLEVAELNHKTAKVAQNNIGIMYYRGEGVPTDIAAADHDHAAAVKSLKNIQGEN